MNRKRSVFFALGLVLVTVGATVSCRAVPEKKLYTASRMKEVMNLRTTAEATTTIILLRNLREGRKGETLEAMESQTDFAVCEVWNYLHNLTGEVKETELQWLRMVKEYRSKYPRKTEAEIDFGKMDEVKQITADTRKKAEKILKELKLPKQNPQSPNPSPE